MSDLPPLSDNSMRALREHKAMHRRISPTERAALQTAVLSIAMPSAEAATSLATATTSSVVTKSVLAVAGVSLLVLSVSLGTKGVPHNNRQALPAVQETATSTARTAAPAATVQQNAVAASSGSVPHPASPIESTTVTRSPVRRPTPELPSSPPGPSTTPVQATSIAEEASLLAAAEGAFRARDRATARRLVDQHAARFQQGVLSPERDALSTMLRCLDRPGAQFSLDAERDFAVRWSGHPLLVARVHAVCVSR